MLEKLKLQIKHFLGLLRWETEDPDLLQTIAKRVIITTLAVVIAWHVIATLVWTPIFSPSLYAITAGMIVISAVALSLQKKFYLLAQIIWYTGLSLLIILAFHFYQKPEILFLFIFLPIMAEVMLGIKITLILDAVIILLFLSWNRLGVFPALPPGYDVVLVFSALVSTVLGWGVSYNLVLSIEMASHHYREARERLNVAQEQRAEISMLLKDVNNANYQLDRLNIMLTEARSQADKAREERDRFALAVSHELRSPLNFIIGFSDLMVNSPSTYGQVASWPPGLYDDVNEIYKSSTHLLQLINDILDMGKMDARQFTVFREKIDFHLIVDDVCGMVRSSVQNKGLKLVVDLEPDLAPVFVDRTRIRQVLLNLVTNSLRFTHQGSITIKAYSLSTELLRVEVIDTGTGIAKADLEKVFHEFQQAGDDTQRSSEGSGLGLSIGRRFVRLHDGEMGVDSEPGKGSVFYFTVPFHQKADEIPLISKENVFQPVAEKNTDSEKEPLVLMLVADAFSGQVFARTLKGFKFTLMTDPLQLATVVRDSYPCAVIVDENLADNPDVRAFISKPPYDVPVLTIPLPISRENRTSNLPPGVYEYLVKPVPRNVLMEVVKKLELREKTILVVDDDPSMSRFVIQSLRSSNGSGADAADEYKILTALDGQEALRFLHSLPVGAIFLDLELTDMHGLTLLQRIQKENGLQQLPVIIISASDPPPTFNPPKQGVYQVLVNRSFDPSEVTDLILNTLKQLPPRFTMQKTIVNSPVGSESSESQSPSKSI